MPLPSIPTEILQGMLIGLAIAVPIGPSCLLCLQRTLSRGAAAGLMTGLGIATIHFLYAAAAVQGLKAAGDFVTAHQSLFRTLTALVLFVFAWRAYALASVVPLNGETAQPLTRAGLLPAYRSALLFAAANPMTLVFFLTVMPSMLNHDMDSRAEGWSAAIVLGVALASAGWWMLVVCCASLARRRLAGLASLRLVNRLAAASLALAGVALVAPPSGGMIDPAPGPRSMTTQTPALTAEKTGRLLSRTPQTEQARR